MKFKCQFLNVYHDFRIKSLDLLSFVERNDSKVVEFTLSRISPLTYTLKSKIWFIEQTFLENDDCTINSKPSIENA